MSFIRAEAALRGIGRMARTSELQKRGVSTRELSRAVRAGEVLRPRQGVYALPDTPLSLRHAASRGGTIACAEAAAAWGLWVLELPSHHHIWMGTAGTPRSVCPDCVVHWDAGRVVVGQPPPVANVLLQMATCCGEEAFFAALESALRHALLPPLPARGGCCGICPSRSVGSWGSPVRTRTAAWSR